MRWEWRLVAGAFVCGVLTVSGCGARATSVSGVVTLDGQPLGGALVRFFPSGSTGQTAATYTDSAGRYRTNISPTPFRVVISSRRVVGQEKNDATPGGPMLDITEEALPSRYSDPTRSELTISPAPNLETTADFALTAGGTVARP